MIGNRSHSTISTTITICTITITCYILCAYIELVMPKKNSIDTTFDQRIKQQNPLQFLFYGLATLHSFVRARERERERASFASFHNEKSREEVIIYPPH